MFRNVITFSLFLAVLIFNIGKLEALEQGDIVYRTSKNGDMYGRNNSWHLTKPGHTGIYVGDGYVVEALGWGSGQLLIFGFVEFNLLSEFVDSSEGQIYLGAKTWNKNEELTSKRRDNIAQIVRDQVGEEYDENFWTQKGPDADDWTCVGLTEKAYESADTPDNLQYASSYGAGDQNYALDITPDGVDNKSFSETKEMSEVSWFNKNIFFPYTQYLQSTLKDVITDLPVSDNFHTLTKPSKTTVSRGGILGPFTVQESNNSSSYYNFYVQPYVTKPDGTTVYFDQISTGLDAGRTRTLYGFLLIPSSSELGTFTFGVKLTDTSGNVIDDDSVKFTVISGTSFAVKRSARRLKRLTKNPEGRVMEGEGWTTIVVPEKGAGSN